MSLPLRLPYCCPARLWRGALWLAYFSAPVTPPLPSPASRGSTRSSKAVMRRAARRRQSGSQSEATEGAPPRGCTGVTPEPARPPRPPGKASCPLAPPLPPSEQAAGGKELELRRNNQLEWSRRRTGGGAAPLGSPVFRRRRGRGQRNV
ncbi:hypothetical protein R6Z07F_011439 [Ovis aries]